jgi:microcystin-dependent protein
MADPFVAEVRIVGFNFAPRGWASCNGQLMPISQNTALFSLLGTTYGGDGRSTFALPNIQGRAPMHSGWGPGLTNRILGEQAGQTSVTLLESEMPAHNHGIFAINTPATTPDIQNNMLAAPAEDTFATRGSRAVTQMNGALATAGGSQAHNNMQPYLTLHFLIALQGVFPPRPS